MGASLPMLLALAVILLVARDAADLKHVIETAAPPAQLKDGVGGLLHVVVVGGIAIAVVSIATAAVIAWQIGRELDATAARLHATSAEMARLLATQEAHAVEQARVARQTAGTMARVEGSAQQFDKDAVRAAEIAGEALAMTAAGAKALEGMVAGMEELRVKSAAVSAQTQHLHKRGEEIGHITLIVGDLANRTSMLALNAAAEAARMGASSKGATNVAADVRGLAAESQRSAERIASILGEIRSSADATLALVEEEQATLLAALALSEKTEHQFLGITAMLDEAHGGAESISRTAARQHEAIREVFADIEAVLGGADASAAGIHEARETMEHVESSAVTLKEMV